MRNFIPVSEPLLDGNEKKYLTEAIDTAWISSEGPFVKKFEDSFSQRVGRKYGISVANGTAALDIAVKSLGLEKDDEVIMPTFTIISCAQAVVNQGGKVIPVDCSLTDYNLITEKIEKNISPKTKAIMVVHVYGLPVNMDEILRIAKKHNLKVIEDAAEMHGQTYNGKPCGSFGDVSIFSFYANKIISTGEGGMVVTDDEDIAEKSRYYRNLCFNNKKRFVHNDLGYNYRFTNLQAALGCAQLERLDEFIEIKRKIGKKYNNFLSENKYLQLPIHQSDFAENIYWVYPLVLKEDFSGNAEFVMNQLAKSGIGTRPFFYPLHLQPILIEQNSLIINEKMPNSEFIYERGFYIPSGLPLSDKEIKFIAKTVNKIVA